LLFMFISICQVCAINMQSRLVYIHVFFPSINLE